MTAGALAGLALRSLRRRALRSALTALTAAVAVATVFATRGLLRGSEVALERDLHRLGTRTVQAVDGAGFVPGSGGARDPLGPADAAAVREGVRASGLGAEVVEARVRLGVASGPRPGGRPLPVPLVETVPAYGRTFDAEVLSGRFLEEGDLAPGAEPVCVLDAETARELGVAAAGAEVAVREAGGERRLRVAGILADPFSLRVSTFAPDLSAAARRSVHQLLVFRNLYLPRRPAAEGEPPGSLMIFAVARERGDAEALHGVLAGAVRAKERGVLVWSRGTWVRNIVETAGEQVQIANIIWAIVLLVALVMIATVTLVGVRERTAEVAVRRSEGATRRQVTLQLLLEGGMLAGAGGLLGLPLGWAAADRLSTLLTWAPFLDLREGVAAVGLGVAVGILAAALPARRAAGWEVVEGLRRGA